MIKRLILITAIALFNICKAQYAATDLSYTCLGNSKYRVKLDVYTECKTNGSMIDRNVFPLFVSSQKLKVTIPNVFFEKVSAIDHVRLFCKSEGDVCEDINSPNRGLRLATFFSTLDLSAYPATDDWEASFIRDSKDEVFTHLVAPGNFAHIATININTSLSTCNSSPSYTSRPILKACNQKTDTLNLGISDADQDELRFSLASPITVLERVVQPMAYHATFSPTKPLNLSSDLKITSDGKLIVAGTQHLDVGATDLIIEEYRNGQKIGTTRRNLQINVLNCVNQKPVVSTFVTPMNASKRTELTVCSGDTIPKLNSLINITDIDHVIDSLPITFTIDNVPVPNSDERIKSLFKYEGLNSKKVSLYAEPKPVFSTATDVKVTMTVKAYDNGCPIREWDEETFTIFVKAKPTFDFVYDRAFLNCNPPTVLNPHNIPDLNLTDTAKPKNVIGNAPFTYQWKIWNKTFNGTYFVVNPNVYNDSRASHTVDVNNHGVTLKITDVNGCSAKDSIYFENGLEFNLDATLRCFGNDSTVIKDLSKSYDTLSPIVKRTWNFGDGDILTGNDSIVKKKYCKEGLYKISLEVETKKGCKAKFDDSLRIYSLPDPNFEVSTNCMNRMIIDDKPFLIPLKGGTENLKSVPYGIQYFASKVYSGKDSTIEIKVQTRASVHVVCDTIIVRFDTDSAAANCSVYNVAPVREYGFNYTKLPSQPLSKIFRVTEDANLIYFHFKPFEFEAQYWDTTLLASNEILMAISKTSIQDRLFTDFDTLVQDKKTNIFKKKCKSFVHEDGLYQDVFIPPHPSRPINDFIFPNFTFEWEKQNNRVQVDSGIYLIKQVITAGQCRKEVSKEVIVYAEPQIDISNAAKDILVTDTLIRNCYGGDTTLYAKALKDPNGGLKYHWHERKTLNLTDVDVPNFPHSDNYSVSEPQIYIVYVQDSKKCDDTSYVTLVDYLKADFDVIPDCDIRNDTLVFQNWSKAGNGPKIISSQWFLQDKLGTYDTSFIEPDTAFARVIRHKTDMDVTLIVTDSLNCQKAFTKPVIRSNFKDSLTLTPAFTDASFCVSDKIKAHAIKLIGDNNHIDSIVWFPGDGRKLVQPGGSKNSDLDNFYITYADDAAYTVRYIAYFNGITRIEKDKSGKDSLVLVKQSCDYKSDSTKKISIKPEFKGKLFKFRTCIPDTVEFIFEKDAKIGDNTVKVNNVYWTVNTRNPEIDPEPNFTFPIRDTNVYSFKKVFTKQHDLQIDFLAKDDNGCVFQDREFPEVKAMDKPAVFGMDSVCLGTESSIRIRHKDGKGGGTIRYSVDYLNTQVAYNQFITKNNTETVKYTFPYPGVAPIRVSAHFPSVYEGSINGDMRAECRGVIDTSIYIKPYPTPYFAAPPVCTGYDTTVFTNMTKFLHQTNNAKDSTVVAYIWDFGDGSAKTNVEHPRHVYQSGGDKAVKLVVVAANGCTADTTLFVDTKLSPTAYFAMDRDSTLINFSDPITFTEKAEPNEIERYEWDFGDGDKGEGREIVHQYKNIDRFQVSLKVTSPNGCYDIHTKTAELKPILLLPNVFSPNADGQNDELFLIYRLIDELEDFKIYNRWGEVVFDAKGNLKARWDGKYKDTDQELGVYVAYVKARGKYGYTYNFKQNITLLR